MTATQVDFAHCYGADNCVSPMPSSPTNIFSPAATPASSIQSVSMFVFAITGAIFLIVTALLIYVLLRYRHRPGDTTLEPVQVFGSNQIELAWTVIPVLIVVVLFLTTARVILGTERAARPAGAFDVIAIGHQFWWEYRYPKLGIVTANELHIPVGTRENPTPAYLELSSADVVHSFWIPALAGKMDMIPNRVNTMWVDPQKPGLYLGQCGQFCGMQHAKMLLRVYADTPEAFAAWVKSQQQVPADSPSQIAGKAVFLQNACRNCHTVAGTSANGKFGPDLTHVGSRDTLASGIIENTPENLKKWIDNPDSFKPGSLMPAMHLNDHDLQAVTAYLSSLR
jgi:cytochrome c oxidase subunit 2